MLLLVVGFIVALILFKIHYEHFKYFTSKPELNNYVNPK
jgi:hypothetical protein